MRVRVAGLWRHPKSKVWWFRMAVPERYRAVVGKREWKFSLDETDAERARLKHAEKLVEIRRLMESIDAQAAVSAGDQAIEIVRRGLEALARSNIEFHAEGGEEFDLARGIDHISYAMLKMLAFRTRLDWGGKHAAAARLEAFGPEADEVAAGPLFESDDPPRLGSGFQSSEHRKAASANIELFEAQSKYQGAALREIARGLLASRDWQAVTFEAQILANAVGVVLPHRAPLFEAVAERILRHLADHRFQHWPDSIDIVLNPMMTSIKAYLTVKRDAANVATPEGRTLTRLFELWRAKNGLNEHQADKTADEWKLAVGRFRELTGTENVAEITPEMVRRYRDKLLTIPSRPKKEISSLPLKQQIEIARSQGLPTLSPPSVGKHVAAIKSLLEHAMTEEGWIGRNPAKGVTVEGARYEGTERDHLTDAEMRLIYGSPLMTDPDACGDTMFWILFLAPFHGSRPGEHCQLGPGNVIQEDGEWIMRFRADRRRRRPQAADGSRPKRLKTSTSVRDVPLHWIVVEGGFLELVELQKQRGAIWIFDDLRPDKYGDRYKYLSREINDALREVGITDPDKAFYSTRHSFKREGRRRRVGEQALDQLAGHATVGIGRKYGQGLPVDLLKEDIDKLEFRSVDWDPVVACALERLRRRQAGLKDAA